MLGLAGVTETASGAKVSDDIQQVYVLDDLRGLLPPIIKPQYVHTFFGPAAAAVRGMFELRAPPDSSIIIPWFRNEADGNSCLFSVLLATAITANLANQNATLRIPIVPFQRAVISTGTGPAGGQILLADATEIPPNFPPLIVPPGGVFNWETQANNQSAFGTIAWAEIPLRAPTTAT